MMYEEDEDLSREELILKYTGTALEWGRYWANKFQVRVDAGFGDDEDVCASSYFALCKAAEKWDRKRSSFRTTLNQWVRAYCIKEVHTLSGKKGKHYFGTDYEELSPLDEQDYSTPNDYIGSELRVELEREDPLYAIAFDIIVEGGTLYDAAEETGISEANLMRKFYTAVKYSGTICLP